MNKLSLIRAFLEQASAQGARSNVLKPIAGILSLCMSAIVIASYLKLEFWVECMFAIFAGLAMALYLFSYAFCLFKDRDCLRSETYTIQKMAIERGFVGDSLTGMIPADRDAKMLRIGGVEEMDAEAAK
jgi:hypothetical protein